MSLRFVALAYALALPAAATTFTSVLVDAVTHSSGRVRWTTDVGTLRHVRFGLTSSYDLSTHDWCEGAGVDHACVVTGLTPNTTYHYTVCANYSGTDCDATDRTFTTSAAPNPAVEIPALPTEHPLPPMPAINGNSYAVSADCSNLAAQIQAAAAADGNLNHEVVIPAGAECTLHSGQLTGNANNYAFQFPAKSGPNASGSGVIVIRSGGNLPPEGARTGPEYAPQMATLRNNVIGVRELSLPVTYGTGACTAGQLWWDFIAALSGWAMKECTNPAGDGYSLVPRTDFSGPPASSCSLPQTWYRRTDVDTACGIYWCGADNKLYQIQLGRQHGFLIPSGAHHYRLVGIRFLPAPVKDFSAAYYTDGSYFPGWFEIQAGAHHIYFDRCHFDGTGAPVRWQTAFKVRADYFVLANCYLEKIDFNLPGEGAISNSTETQPFNLTGGQYITVSNNFVESSGFGLICSNDENSVCQDVVVRGNTFARPERYRLGTPENAAAGGKFYYSRHSIELKRGKRWLVEGNICDGNFATLNQAHFFLISPRGGDAAPTAIQVHDVTVRNNLFRNGTAGFMVIGADDAANLRNQVTQRVLIENNLLTMIDGRSAGSYGLKNAHCLTLMKGPESVTYRHNTCRKQAGYFEGFLWGDVGTAYGLDFRDNINYHYMSAYGSYGGLQGIGHDLTYYRGTAGLNAAWPAAGAWAFDHNAVVNVSSENPANYPPGNYWVSTESGIGFRNLAAEDFRLQQTSPIRSGAPPVSGTSGPATDGSDVGTRHYQLRAALGEVSNVRAEAGSRTVVLRYGAPDGRLCQADVSGQSAFASFSRTSDAGGARERELIITGLTPGTQYYYKLHCGRSVSGTFATGADTSNPASVTMRLNPPASLPGVASVRVEHGATSALGSVVTAACSPDCTAIIPGTIREPLYYRVSYLNGSAETLALTRVLTMVPQ